MTEAAAASEVSGSLKCSATSWMNTQSHRLSDQSSDGANSGSQHETAKPLSASIDAGTGVGPDPKSSTDPPGVMNPSTASIYSSMNARYPSSNRSFR